MTTFMTTFCVGYADKTHKYVYIFLMKNPLILGFKALQLRDFLVAQGVGFEPTNNTLKTFYLQGSL